jgi:gamma-glutamylaminecyclotransferase
MIEREGEGERVTGELYEIDDETLEKLDVLESVGKPGNFRTRLAVAQGEGGQAQEAYAYVKAPDLATPRHSGYLADYQDRRFVPPWERDRKQGTA